MINIFSNIDFRDGKLSTNKAILLSDTPLEDQKQHLFEDILQITYKKCTLDIGWYFEDFEISKDSFFWVRVIVNEDWSNSVFDKKTNNVTELKKFIEEAINLITKQLA
ncbi:hypothetical protein [uncultured Kordia sp.]|uniref:hypothetical protein n=1 Tax=uncultured Kordia sp. TaxID=507699 RepID=UPI00261B00C5|nr:hypothetical protein [uncultured Kordia sp.]